MARLEDGELKRLALDGIRAEVEAFGSGAPGAFTHRAEGVLACVSPVAADRSLFNSVSYQTAAALSASLDELARTYESEGVRAWTVWVPDSDRATAATLESRGHALDASPRLMALELSDLDEAPAPVDGLRISPCPQQVAAEMNDRAYGYDGCAFKAALAQRTLPELRWVAALAGDEPCSCLATIAVGGDRVVTGVATPREHRGQGIASWLLRSTLVIERECGARTASLQATKLGAGIYERIGFRDLGFVEMWERRAA